MLVEMDVDGRRTTIVVATEKGRARRDDVVEEVLVATEVAMAAVLTAEAGPIATKTAMFR